MKITDIKWEKLHINLLEPFKIAFTEIGYAEVVLIRGDLEEDHLGVSDRREGDFGGRQVRRFGLGDGVRGCPTQ